MVSFDHVGLKQTVARAVFLKCFPQTIIETYKSSQVVQWMWYWESLGLNWISVVGEGAVPYLLPPYVTCLYLGGIYIIMGKFCA